METKLKLFFDSVELGKVEIVKTLLLEGMNIEVIDFNGCTPLDLAVKNDNYEIINLLISSGVDVNEKSVNDLTALHSAVKYKSINVVRQLINEGADVNAKDKNGFTPLHYAATNVLLKNPTSFFEVLISAGADVNAKCKEGNTPLNLLTKSLAHGDGKGYGCSSLCFLPIMNEENEKIIPYDEILKVFVKHGADFNTINDFGQGPIYWAVIAKNIVAAKALVFIGGIDVNSEFSCRYLRNFRYSRASILHIACNRQDIKVIDFLLENGANINALTEKNLSPLHALLYNSVFGGIYLKKKIEVLKYLLDRNANINVNAHFKYNILTLNSRTIRGQYTCKTLLEHIAKLHALERPIQRSIYETISNNTVYDAYFKKSSEEVGLIKNTKLYSDSWISCYNLLVDDEKELLKYAGNESLIKAFAQENFVEKFPIYGEYIHKRFEKAMEKRKLWNSASIILGDIYSLDSSHCIIDNILRFFDTKDLKKLCE